MELFIHSSSLRSHSTASEALFNIHNTIIFYDVGLFVHLSNPKYEDYFYQLDC
jgi:hypothetical protein